MSRLQEVRRLHARRPRSPFLVASVAVLSVLAVYAWVGGDVDVADAFSARRMENLDRFLSREIVPFPMREKGFDAGILGDWAGDIMSRHGWSGLVGTVGIAVVSIILAGIAGAVFCMPAARTLMSPEPWASSGRPPSRLRRFLFGGVVHVTRFVQLLLRSIPEFVWVFLFLAMLGPTAWPAILALAIHNAGILGKLNAEVVENLEPGALRSLRSAGATRAQIATGAIFPLALPRFLLYFFYRFETCVREATILGILGIVSLGYYIQQARAAQYYDEMLLLVLLGAVIVLSADLVSALARGLVRRAA